MALIQTVNQDGTTTTLTASFNPGYYGQHLTFTAAVTADSPGSGVPSGSVTFYDGSTPLQTVALTDGSATYSTSSLSVGSHGITAVYSGDANYITSTSPDLNEYINASSTTPSVQFMIINGGQQQRSMLTSLTVNFNEVVDASALANAFTLTRVSDGATVHLTLAIAVVNAQTVATLTFSGPNTEGSDGLYQDLSLADGNWTLTINQAYVISGGAPMAANYYQIDIKRLFGDYYGTGEVDSSDLGVLGTTFGLSLGNPAFIAAFDSDGNGEIDSVDLGRFGSNFGLSI